MVEAIVEAKETNPVDHVESAITTIIREFENRTNHEARLVKDATANRQEELTDIEKLTTEYIFGRESPADDDEQVVFALENYCNLTWKHFMDMKPGQWILNDVLDAWCVRMNNLEYYKRRSPNKGRDYVYFSTWSYHICSNAQKLLFPRSQDDFNSGIDLELRCNSIERRSLSTARLIFLENLLISI
ncbi:OLC1v1001640C1 [Oldenlandia corymbosa var. corymbosa]|uniref:OLC1v1001640C1 n=1 Tax=Oldenlandia corymbosa var. corymbosa TaxID=529605 RepID=A0AAV1D891_OLDCO|nr:OLC1v1001640C1 [Oldenlandia corymbosa var. corymbosa]